MSNVSSAPLKVSSKSSRRSVSSQTALPVASLLLCCQFEHQGPGDGRRGVTPHGAITAGAWRPYISFPIAFLLLLLLSSFSRPLTSTKLLENFVVACFKCPAQKLAFLIVSDFVVIEGIQSCNLMLLMKGISSAGCNWLFHFR